MSLEKVKFIANLEAGLPSARPGDTVYYVDNKTIVITKISQVEYNPQAPHHSRYEYRIEREGLVCRVAKSCLFFDVESALEYYVKIHAPD